MAEALQPLPQQLVDVVLAADGLARTSGGRQELEITTNLFSGMTQVVEACDRLGLEPPKADYPAIYRFAASRIAPYDAPKAPEGGYFSTNTWLDKMCDRVANSNLFYTGTENNAPTSYLGVLVGLIGFGAPRSSFAGEHSTAPLSKPYARRLGQAATKAAIIFYKENGGKTQSLLKQPIVPIANLALVYHVRAANAAIKRFPASRHPSPDIAYHAVRIAEILSLKTNLGHVYAQLNGRLIRQARTVLGHFGDPTKGSGRLALGDRSPLYEAQKDIIDFFKNRSNTVD